MYCVLSIVQLGHDQRDILKDYWSTIEQILIGLYGRTMTRAKLFHILTPLHFSDTTNEPDKTDEHYC
jgi:hypothetical protein